MSKEGAVSLVIGDPHIFGRIYVGTNGCGIIRGDDPRSPG